MSYIYSLWGHKGSDTAEGLALSLLLKAVSLFPPRPVTCLPGRCSPGVSSRVCRETRYASWVSLVSCFQWLPNCGLCDCCFPGPCVRVGLFPILITAGSLEWLPGPQTCQAWEITGGRSGGAMSTWAYGSSALRAHSRHWTAGPFPSHSWRMFTCVWRGSKVSQTGLVLESEDRDSNPESPIYWLGNPSRALKFLWAVEVPTPVQCREWW